MKIPKKLNKKFIQTETVLFVFIYLFLIYLIHFFVYTKILIYYYIIAIIILIYALLPSIHNKGRSNLFTILNYYKYINRNLNTYQKDRYFMKEELEEKLNKKIDKSKGEK